MSSLCFGVYAVTLLHFVLDMFCYVKESGRHTETLDAVMRYLDMGTYSEWDEEKRLEFLTKELKGKRPLVPPTIEVMSENPMNDKRIVKFALVTFGMRIHVFKLFYP